MNMQIPPPMLGYAVALGICATACSSHEHRSIELKNQSLGVAQSESHTQHKLSLDVGGALSKDFQRDLKYHALKVRFVAGTNGTFVHLGKGLQADSFVVGVESTQGKAILQILDSERPWTWESIEAVPFANALYFNGNVSGKAWKYTSVYRDAQLESLLVRLRQELERR